MNAMTKALKTAGIAIPHNQRIWQWLFDNGKHTSKEISAALSVPQNNVATLLGDMIKRKMVVKTSEFSTLKGGDTAYYAVHPKVRAFILLPKPKKVAPVVEPVVEVTVPAPVLVESPAVIKPSIDTLSVNEAFALYKQLHEMFGGRT